MNQEKGYDQYEFAAWILAIEASGLKDLYAIQTTIGSRRLWQNHVDAQGYTNPIHAASCPKSPCFNGVFNYLGGMESALGRYKNLIAGDDNALFQSPYISNDLIRESAKKMSVPNPGTYDNNTPIQFGYYEFGNPRLKDFEWIWGIWGSPYTVGNQSNQISYLNFNEFNSAVSVVLTLNQRAYWENK